MSSKFFALIHGGEIRLAPNVKVVPADTFSTLITAEEGIKKIHEDTEQYRLEVSKECEGIKEKAYRDGYVDGFQQWAEHVAALEKEINKVHAQIKKAAIPLALKAAKKIVGRELEVSEDATVEIIANSLKAVAAHKKIIIWVCKTDIERLERRKDRLKEVFEHLESLSIRPREDIEPNGCVIETESGIINAQLEHKWEALAKAFASLIEEQPQDTT